MSKRIFCHRRKIDILLHSYSAGTNRNYSVQNTAQKCTGSYITLFRSRQRSNPFRILSAFRSPACQLASFVSGNPNNHFCSNTTSARFVLPSALMSPEITGGSVAVAVVVLVAAAVVVFVVVLVVVVVVTVVVTLVVTVVVSVFVCHF